MSVILKAQLDGLNQQLVVRWAADCAEAVLPVWVAVFPYDTRPADAVAAARAWCDNPCSITADVAQVAGYAARDAAACRISALSAATAATAAWYAAHAAFAVGYDSWASYAAGHAGTFGFCDPVGLLLDRLTPDTDHTIIRQLLADGWVVIDAIDAATLLDVI
ncbi:putative immunity protein [Gemmatimonas sp.]|uniref:putative immunity protein n=1 Tax=Gemmatimonas sp. TaxID=1962908 RepID=UPI0035669BBA